MRAVVNISEFPSTYICIGYLFFSSAEHQRDQLSESDCTYRAYYVCCVALWILWWIIIFRENNITSLFFFFKFFFALLLYSRQRWNVETLNVQLVLISRTHDAVHQARLIVAHVPILYDTRDLSNKFVDAGTVSCQVHTVVPAQDI